MAAPSNRVLQGQPCIFTPVQGPPGAAPQPHPSWRTQGQRVVLLAQRPAPQTPLGVSQPPLQVQAAMATMAGAAVTSEPQSEAPQLPKHLIAQPVLGDGVPGATMDAVYDLVDDAQQRDDEDPRPSPVPPVRLFQGTCLAPAHDTPEQSRPAPHEDPNRSRSGGLLAAPPAFAGSATARAQPRSAPLVQATAPGGTEVSNADLLAFMQGFRTDVGGRFDRLEDGQNLQAAQIHDLQERTQLHEQATQALMRRVADIEARPPTPSGSSAPPSSASSTGGRDPFAYDPTILRANVPGLASASLVWEAFQQVVVAAKCRLADFEMVGSMDEGRLAKRFTFK